MTATEVQQEAAEGEEIAPAVLKRYVVLTTAGRSHAQAKQAILREFASKASQEVINSCIPIPANTAAPAAASPVTPKSTSPMKRPQQQPKKTNKKTVTKQQEPQRQQQQQQVEKKKAEPELSFGLIDTVKFWPELFRIRQEAARGSEKGFAKLRMIDGIVMDVELYL